MKVIKGKKVDVNELAILLVKGKVLVLPTDTVYGLICDVRSKKAIQRIFRIKRRNLKKPIPVFVRNMKMAKELARIDKKQEIFLRKVWPGRVTAVLKRRAGNKLYGVEKDTIALRMPDHKLIKNLFRKIDFPLSGTSANISGKEPVIEVKELLDQLGRVEPDLIVDGGRLKERKSSKIYDLTQKPTKILRE